MENIYKAHVFICTNSPAEKKAKKCGYDQSEDLHKKVKELASQKTWAKEVRINKSGCLGQCEKGVAAVIYPQAKWFFNLNIDDSAKIIEEIDRLFK